MHYQNDNAGRESLKDMNIIGMATHRAYQGNTDSGVGNRGTSCPALSYTDSGHMPEIAGSGRCLALHGQRGSDDGAAAGCTDNLEIPMQSEGTAAHSEDTV